MKVFMLPGTGVNLYNVSLNKLLEEKINLMLGLYGTELIPTTVHFYFGCRDLTWYVDIVNIRKTFPLQLKIPSNSSLAELCLADEEMIDYISFYVVMECNPKKQPDELITYYALKYGYKLPVVLEKMAVPEDE